jgi:hypothetical protein
MFILLTKWNLWKVKHYICNLTTFCFGTSLIFLRPTKYLFCFAHAVRELDVPGEIYERKMYPFEFSTVEMPYETYNGTNVRLR